MSYLSGLGSAVHGALSGRREKGEFTAGHLDIFADDLDYLFRNSKKIFAKSYAVRGGLDAGKMREIAKCTERNCKILKKLGSMYENLDVASFDAGLDYAIRRDMEDAGEMMAMCRRELEGEVYGADLGMFKVPLITRIKDAAEEVAFDIGRLNKIYIP